MTNRTIQAANRQNVARGLSLLELLLAMTITVMVAAAIAGMLGAVSSGVGTRRDSRTIMVLSNNAESRFSAYIAPSRCVLAAGGGDLTLWLNDSRQSNSVHASEIRWLVYDSNAGAIDVYYVHFPDAWTKAAKDLADNEYPMNTNWSLVLTAYEASGWILHETLVDSLQSVALTLDAAAPMDCRHLNYQLAFRANAGPAVPVLVAATIREHVKPAT